MTWTPRKPRHGDSSASINPASTRPRSTSTSSRCASWPRFSRPEKSTSFLADMFITINDPTRCTSSPSAQSSGAEASGTQKKSRRVDGKWTLDKKFNGQADTTPDGVIYLITGAGGQHLYNPEQQDDSGIVAGIYI